MLVLGGRAVSPVRLPGVDGKAQAGVEGGDRFKESRIGTRDRKITSLEQEEGSGRLHLWDRRKGQEGDMASTAGRRAG